MAPEPLTPCGRCGHAPDWHRLDDSLNISPCDPDAPFRCIGYDCTTDGPRPVGACDCPDYVRAASPTPEATEPTEADCTCTTGGVCDEYGDPGCAYCRSLDSEVHCPSDPEPTCATCGGSGRVLRRVPSLGDSVFRTGKPCPDCQEGGS